MSDLEQLRMPDRAENNKAGFKQRPGRSIRIAEQEIQLTGESRAVDSGVTDTGCGWCSTLAGQPLHPDAIHDQEHSECRCRDCPGHLALAGLWLVEQHYQLSHRALTGF
jgi:hypothetical protein